MSHFFDKKKILPNKNGVSLCRFLLPLFFPSLPLFLPLFSPFVFAVVPVFCFDLWCIVLLFFVSFNQCLPDEYS